MAHDLIIRGGMVLDGTGAEPVRADIAIDGDRITVMGDLADTPATRHLDATGQVVTPGFVDLHTHLDAQIAWDPFMTSSSWHGVTTVLMGNCGVTFAPVASESRAYLAELMESVEDIPREAILGGLPWDWSTFPQYLDSVQRMNPALNVVGMVGHCAVRYHVMGERSMDEHARATPEELAAMRAIVAESVAGGAVGFSTSRILLHTVPDGRKVPGTYAPVEEYLAVADGMNDAGGGLFQGVLDFETKFQHELDLLRTMARRGGRVLFSGGVGNGTADAASFWDTTLADIGAHDGSISAIAMTRPSGSLMGLHQVPPVAGPTWRSVMTLPTLEQRLAALADAAMRRDLVEEGKARGTWYDPRLIFPLGQGDVPEYHLEGDESVAVLAERAGLHPVEWIIERLLESHGREMFNVWFFNRNRANLGAFLNLDAVCPGLGDAGAHAGQICDADAPTHYLTAWCRDRKLTGLADAVHRLSAKPAAVLGLVDRGTLRVGAYADVNVFDPEALQIGYPEYVHDFPNGKGRLRVGATGYAATLVNGDIVTEQGVNTGARPGRVLREFRR